MNATALASEAQVSYIRRLLAGRVVDAEFVARCEARLAEGLERRLATRTITWLLARPAKPVTPVVDAPAVPLGRYAVEAEDGHLAFYKVWQGHTGLRVSLQVSDSEQVLSQATGRAVLAKILEVTPLEASKAYGREIGSCGVCGRTLTNEESRAAGIGPVCAGRGF